MGSKQVEVMLKIKGTDGFVKDEEYSIAPGRSIIIGRSRTCDISLRRTQRYKELKNSKKSSTVDLRFRTVSRKHLKVNYNAPDDIELEDLSSNGTFLDGEKIKRVVISDLDRRKHSLLIGVEERFVLSLA